MESLILKRHNILKFRFNVGCTQTKNLTLSEGTITTNRKNLHCQQSRLVPLLSICCMVIIIGLLIPNVLNICSHESCLLDVQAISSCSVSLLDGQTVVATHACIVKLTYFIILCNIFFVPQLKFNLISVSRLSNDVNCFIQFNSNLSDIHDQYSREVIGLGE